MSPSLPSPASQAALENLHPALWRANQLGGGASGVTASGFAALDAELPGGGWPHRVLTELLLPHPGVGEMRLLAPALAALARTARPARSERGQAAAESGGRCLMLFDPPAALCAGALAQLGVDVQQLMVVRGREQRGRPPGAALRRLLPPGADVLWALEQALKSGHLGAVLAWLPAPLKADALRRLQMAAQAHDGPAFVLRELEARSRPSAAPLRLALQSAGVDGLQLQLLKRRGPPLARPLHLPLPAVLSARQRARALPGRRPHEPVLPARAVSTHPD